MYGYITVGSKDEPKQINIIEFIQATFNDNRLITVAELEDGSYCLTVENPESSGRHSQNKMWLSKESFVGLLTTSMMFFEAKGENMQELIKQATNSGGR